MALDPRALLRKLWEDGQKMCHEASLMYARDQSARDRLLLAHRLIGKTGEIGKQGQSAES